MRSDRGLDTGLVVGGDKRNCSVPWKYHVLKVDGPVKSRETGDKVKKIQIQGAQILRNEAYLLVHRSDEGCSATQKVDFLGSRQD